MIHNATSWAIRTGQIQLAPPKAAPSAETIDDAIRCEIPRSAVPFDLLDEIERTVRLASRTLGLDPPRVRWLPAETRGKRGVVFPEALGSIWVVVQDAKAARETALHELRHVWQLQLDQYRWTTKGLATYEQRQADADEFARTWRWDAPPVSAAPAAAPVGAHHQRSAGGAVTYTLAADQEAARREWQQKYGPLHEAQRQYVAHQRDYWRRR